MPAIALVAQGFIYVLGLTDPETGFIGGLGRYYLAYGLFEAPILLALVWFARRASRLSLTHAFFLVAFSILRPWDPVHWNWSLESLPYVYVTILIGVLITYSIMLSKVWLVGNFELRVPLFAETLSLALWRQHF